MLRRLYSPESQLLELCKSGSWESVFTRTQTHPAEAKVNDSARTGNGSTALSIAVRSRAPFAVMKDLLEADKSQIGVVHMVRGSILHEALTYRVEDEVLVFLVEKVIQYENQRATVQSIDPFTSSDTLLGKTDELGKTILHHMVKRMATLLESEATPNTTNCNIFKALVESFPQSVATLDVDGDTPLILLLLVSRFGDDPLGKLCENSISSMIRTMLRANPSAVNVVHRLPRPWCYRSKHYGLGHKHCVQGEGAPTPLSCAILHGRSMETLEILLSTHRELGSNACSIFVSHHQEVPLHVAVSMNCSAETLTKLVDEEPQMVYVPDAKGLLPLDWLWIRHVTDWCSNFAFTMSSVSVSPRRYISSHFLEWQKRVTKFYVDMDESEGEDTTSFRKISKLRCIRNAFLEKASPIITTMARLKCNGLLITSQENMNVNTKCLDNQVPLLHSTCAINCPIVFVKLSYDNEPSQLRIRETYSGRLPLHLAAARAGYTKSFPTGITNIFQRVEELSAVQLLLARYSLACRVTDWANRLPLHIAIDHAKENCHRLDSHRSTARTDEENEVPVNCYDDVTAILDTYPSALHRRDGRTMLYPFQQAAEGIHCNVGLTFLLIRRNPVLIQSACHIMKVC